MPTVTLQQAQATLPDLIRQLTPDAEIMIIDNGRPVARLLTAPATKPQRIPRLGTVQGTVLSMQHFDDPLDDFKEYME